MATTTEVVQHHLLSFGARDLEGILSDYAPDAVLCVPDGALRGHEAIGGLFRVMLAEFGKPGAEFQLLQQLVDGDHAYIVWTARTADNVYELGTDTFVVRNGRIVFQSFAGLTKPRD
jgi:ketosteroid isomerase-like protein